MIIDYDRRYDDDIKTLFVELQETITKLDKEGFNVVTPSYKEKYFKKIMQNIAKYNGKIFLYEENDKIVGFIVGYISEAMRSFDFRSPKRGRIAELIVSETCRRKGIGTRLLEKMEEFLRYNGCENIVIEVLAYNKDALYFYQKHGYHPRVIDVTKNI